MYELGWIQDFIDGGSIYGPSKFRPSEMGFPAFRGTESAKIQTC